MNAPNLCGMPDAVMAIILQKLDFMSIQRLRKVCRDLRNFIDDTHQTGTINSIKLLIGPDKITVDYEAAEKIKVDYKLHKDGCLVGTGKEKLLKNEHFLDVFLKDLSLILRFFTNSKCKNLEFFGIYPRCPVDNQDTIFEFLKAFEKFLKSKLQTTKFQMEAVTQDQVLSILPYLDPEKLTEIRIFENQIFKDIHWIEMSKIVELEQWKMAKKVIIEQCFDRKFLKYFSHFEKVSVVLDVINSEDLENLKNMFLHSTTIRIFLISYWTIDDSRQFLEEKITFFGITNINDVLRVYHNTQNRFIDFHKIPKDEVPLNSKVMLF